MSVFNKLEDIKIKNEKFFPEADMEVLNNHFDFYSMLYRHYENQLNTMLEFEQKEENLCVISTYIRISDGTSSHKIAIHMRDLTKRFLDNVCYYFENKYKIVFSNKIEKLSFACEEESRFCELNELLNVIVDSLDGSSFLEKSIQEIKRNALTKRTYFEHKKSWNYDIKGKIIKFRISIDNIIPALKFFDNNENDIIDKYSYNKIETINPFNNGNTDVKFLTSEYASEFARNYLGYVAQ